MPSRAVQPENAWSPRSVTPAGIDTPFSDGLSWKHQSPMLVTPGWIVTRSRLGHSRKAQSPMRVTGQPPSVAGTVMEPATVAGEMAALSSL